MNDIIIKKKIIFFPSLYFIAICLIFYGSSILCLTTIQFFQIAHHFEAISLDFWIILFRLNILIINSSILTISTSFSLILTFILLEKKIFNFAFLRQNWYFQAYVFCPLVIIVIVIAFFSNYSLRESIPQINKTLTKILDRAYENPLPLMKSGQKFKFGSDTFFYIRIKEQQKSFLLIDAQKDSEIRKIIFSDNEKSKYQELTYSFPNSLKANASVKVTQKTNHINEIKSYNKKVINKILFEVLNNYGLAVADAKIENRFFLKNQQEHLTKKRFLFVVLPMTVLLLLFFNFKVRENFDFSSQRYFFFWLLILYCFVYLITLSQNYLNINQRQSNGYVWQILLLLILMILILFFQHATFFIRLSKLIYFKLQNFLFLKNKINFLENTMLIFYFVGALKFFKFLLSCVILLTIIYFIGQIFFLLHNNGFSIQNYVFEEFLFRNQKLYTEYLPLVIILCVPISLALLKKSGFFSPFIFTSFKRRFLMILFSMILFLLFFSVFLREVTNSRAENFTLKEKSDGFYFFNPVKNFFIYEEKIIYFKNKILLPKDRFNVEHLSIIDFQKDTILKADFASYDNQVLTIQNEIFLEYNNHKILPQNKIFMNSQVANLIMNYEFFDKHLPFVENIQMIFSANKGIISKMAIRWLISNNMIFLLSLLLYILIFIFSLVRLPFNRQ